MPEPPSIDRALLAALVEAGDEVWNEARPGGPRTRNHRFVPSDPYGAYEALRNLRSRATTFVELGSGAGIVTILADLLGFEAYGIELEPWLYERSLELAERFGSRAVFAEGTFVDPEYQDEIEHLSADVHTPTGGAYGFEELGLELADFDLVFAFPWPGEEDWLFELMRRYARPGALLLTYGATEGFQVVEDF
ncbi:MAG: hypothetical protein WD226_07130 [Planctomycetota bacterium]